MTDDTLHSVVDALFGPTPIYEHSATLRVAVLYDASGELLQAVEDVGLEVVYSREPSIPTEDVDFDIVPDFDFLTVNLPDGMAVGDALVYALRFLRVRRPTAFVFVGGPDIMASGSMTRIRGRIEQLGYQIRDAVSGSVAARHTVIVGMPPDTPFSWPVAGTVEAADADLLRVVLAWLAGFADESNL